MKRTRKDFIQGLVSLGLQYIDAKKIVEDILKIITKSLIKKEKVLITNIGKFFVVKKNQRTFINPKTKKITFIPSHYKARFIPSRNLIKFINEK